MKTSCHHGVGILLGWIFMALVCLGLYFPIRALSHFEKAPSLLIVSFDGFRWNYLNRTSTPHFDRIIDHGVYARRGLNNVFPTSTLTNHWSMVTGLYAESHGVVENDMYDPVLNKTFIPLYRDKYAVNDQRFYDAGAEPIWVTNQLQNEHGRSGSIMWWGAEYVVKGVHTTYHMPFDVSVDDKYRIDTIISWFTADLPINLGLLYFSEPDHTAHKCGPDSENVTRMIKHADEMTGYLLERLKDKDLLDDMNIIITSDHGFAATPKDRLIHLDDFIDPSWYHMVHYSPAAAIIPIDEEKGKLIFQKLEDASKTHHFVVYKKAQIPERLHYRNNVRITPILAIADITYSFISKIPDENFTLKGTHGYDNQNGDMHPFFMAIGPSFKEHFQVETFHSVDLYSLMCSLLQLHPAPNNGTMDIVGQLLKHRHDTVDWTFGTYMTCLILVASIGGIFTVAACRHHRYMKRKLRQFQGSLNLNFGKHSLLPDTSAQVPLLSDEEAADDDEF